MGASRTFTRGPRSRGAPSAPSGAAREDPTVDTLCTNRPPSRGGTGVLFRDICQMGSLAGAAYLLHNNAGVLRQAQWEQKSHVEHKRQGLLD
jgi:hypothetical protein